METFFADPKSKKKELTVETRGDWLTFEDLKAAQWEHMIEPREAKVDRSYKGEYLDPSGSFR
jgi:hypothetical protein